MLKNKKGFCFVFVYAVAFYITENRLRVQRNDGCCVCLNVLSCFASQTRAFSNPIAPFFYVCVCVCVSFCFFLFFFPSLNCILNSTDAASNAARKQKNSWSLLKLVILFYIGV